mgnify:CR=1 FL=1
MRRAVIASLVLVAIASTAAAAALSGAPAAVHSALALNVVPDPLTPTIAEIAVNEANTYSDLSLLKSNCNPFLNTALVDAPAPCVGGDTTSSKVVVLVGDSHVGNWFGVLSTVLLSRHEKLNAFAFPSCPTAEVAGYSVNLLRWRDCSTWHRHLDAVVRSIHPVAIMAVSGPGFLTTYSTSTWAADMAKEFKGMTRGLTGVQTILIGTTPSLLHHAPACVAAHSASLQKCTYNYRSTKSQYRKLLVRDAAIVRASKAQYLATTPWFCESFRCPVVVANTLVYVDADHISSAYAERLAPDLSAKLTALGLH